MGTRSLTEYECDGCGFTSFDPHERGPSSRVNANISSAGEDVGKSTQAAISAWLCGTCTNDLLSVIYRPHEDAAPSG